MRPLVTAVACFLLLARVVALGADESPRKSMSAVRVSPVPPKIDGVLDDLVWEQAPRFGGFTQRIPDEGKPASDSTSVQFAYDDEALYAAVMCYDREPDKIVARLFRRDQGYRNTDWVHLSIDSSHDRQTAYSFFVTAAGGRMDGYYYNDDWEDDTWDGVWEGRAHVGAQGWSAEFRIPFSVLRFTPHGEHVMGLNVDRFTSRKNEDVFWTHIPQKEKGWVSRFGELRGIAGISPPAPRELFPYAIARSTFQPKTAAHPNGRDEYAGIGMDMRYGLASNVSLNATVNPDYGQVEADPAVLNLSVYETFYEERRPFFIEGNQLFQTPFQLFYSRRIGRPPERLRLPAGYQEVDRPEFTSIIGAAKLTGKTAGKASFGLIEAVTAQEHATAAAAGAGSGRFVVEPRTNYLVGRLQQDLYQGNSKVGVIGTAVNRAGTGTAYAGGVDWTLFAPGNAYQASGQVAGSRTASFGTDRQGYAAQVELGKGAGSVQGDLFYQALSPGFDINDLGFVSRVGRQVLLAQVSAPEYRVQGPFRYRNVSLTSRTSWNYDRLVFQKQLELYSSLTLKNEWRLRGGVYHNLRALDDLDTRGGPPIERPASTYAWIRVTTDSRRMFGADGELDWEGNAAGSRWRSAWVRGEARPSTRVELSLQPQYTWNDDHAQWVTNPDGNGDGVPDHFVYARLKSQVLDVTARVNVVFTPDLSLQLYLQPFVAVGQYGSLRELARPRSYAFTPYVDPSLDPDFRRRSLRGNLVFRWEYRPGSTLFVVWSQARQASDRVTELEPIPSLRHTFTDDGTNVLLVKLNYWLSI